MGAEKAEAKTFRLSDRLSVEITIGSGVLCVEWNPDMPDELTPSELQVYRKARHEMVMRWMEMK